MFLLSVMIKPEQMTQTHYDLSP